MSVLAMALALPLALRSLCLRIAAVLAFVGLFGAAGHAPLLWAFVVVGLLHLSVSVFLRWFIVHKASADAPSAPSD